MQRRLNTIHLLLCGSSFELALRHSWVSERCLQFWIARFNDHGIGGITYRPRPGLPRALNPARVAAEILPVVDDPALVGERHWTAVKLCGWHHIESKFLPPYSPDFKPIERLWQHLKGNQLAGLLTKSGAELSDKLFDSIRALLKTPDVLRSVCKTHTP